jgi:PBP1b-binding outer membrane lipoprotein LpoB
MKVLKNLVAVAAITFCLASCSQHTTCAAYGANTYQMDSNQDEINVQCKVENVEWM